MSEGGAEGCVVVVVVVVVIVVVVVGIILGSIWAVTKGTQQLFYGSMDFVRDNPGEPGTRRNIYPQHNGEIQWLSTEDESLLTAAQEVEDGFMVTFNESKLQTVPAAC